MKEQELVYEVMEIMECSPEQAEEILADLDVIVGIACNVVIEELKQNN